MSTTHAHTLTRLSKTHSHAALFKHTDTLVHSIIAHTSISFEHSTHGHTFLIMKTHFSISAYIHIHNTPAYYSFLLSNSHTYTFFLALWFCFITAHTCFSPIHHTHIPYFGSAIHTHTHTHIYIQQNMPVTLSPKHLSTYTYHVISVLGSLPVSSKLK